jgi:hypothetical protein
MADKGSNNWLWWSIGGIATLGLGLGIYYFVKGNKDAKAKAKEEEDKKKATNGGGGTTYVPPSPAPSPKPTTDYPKKATPFTTTIESNAFRKYVNEKDPNFAKAINLDISLSSASSTNNSTIQKAFYKYGEEYLKSLQNPQGNANQQQSNTWSSANYTSNVELKNLISGAGQDIDRTGGDSFEWDSTNSYPTAFVRFYDNGYMTIEKKLHNYTSRYAKNEGNWKKVVDGFEFNFGNKNYKAKYDGGDIVNTLWGLMKDSNYFRVSDGGFVQMSGNMGATKFGMKTDGTKLQDVML